MNAFVCRLSVLLLPLLALVLTGCPSATTLQTAKTLPPLTGQGGVGGAYVSLNEPSLQEAGLPDSAPLGVAWARYGILDRLDVGAQVALIGTGVVDAKYMIIGDQESLFAVSSGLALGTLKISSGQGDNEITNTYFDVHVPAYASIHPTSWFAAYASPRYVLRAYTLADSSGKSTSVSHWLAATAGIQVGKTVGVIMEASLMAPVNALGSPMTQFTGGLFMAF